MLVQDNEHMRWTLLAVCCLHASCPLLATAFAVAMPVANGVQRALLWQTGRRNIVDLSRTRLVAVQPGTSASALRQPQPTRLILRQQQAPFSTSQIPPPPSNQGKRRSLSLGAAVPGTETNAEGQTAETAAAAAAAAPSAAGVAAKQRASSRYIPSSYRGVRGGPKGKWKARIVSKGGLRQLGTFE